MKKLLVPGKSALALTKNQWNWITIGDPNGEFQYRFWDFYFAKKTVLLSKMNNQPVATFSVFLTGGGDSLSERKELITKTVKRLLRMYQYRTYGKSIPPDMSFSIWFLEPALEELKVKSEEELLRKFPNLRQRQYVLLVNDFSTGIEIEVPDRLIEPEIVH
jgi:hypothetical protein